MNDVLPKRSPEDEQIEFATERSHADAKTANEHARAAIQSIILVNGGAATAIFAFASRGGNDPTAQNILVFLGISLYVMGVLIGAYNIRVLTNTTLEYMSAWNAIALREPKETSDAAFARASRNDKLGHQCFTVSLICFGLGSLATATAIVFNPFNGPAGQQSVPTRPSPPAIPNPPNPLESTVPR